MTTPDDAPTHPPQPIPADDPTRHLTIARPDTDQSLTHFGIVGDTYTILLSGADTAGRYCLIDMLVPPGGGPAPHRHDFEEMFTVLVGEIEANFRGEKTVVRTGETINIPANAPHEFHNVSDQPARLLCMCSPAGQEDFFREVGQPLETRTDVPPPMGESDQQAFMAKAQKFAPIYRTELLPPGSL